MTAADRRVAVLAILAGSVTGLCLALVVGAYGGGEDDAIAVGGIMALLVSGVASALGYGR